MYRAGLLGALLWPWCQEVWQELRARCVNACPASQRRAAAAAASCYTSPGQGSRRSMPPSSFNAAFPALWWLCYRVQLFAAAHAKLPAVACTRSAGCGTLWHTTRGRT